MQSRRVVTVGQLNNYVQELLESDANLAGLWVKGEVSNFKHHSSGHMYFTLKDAGASVRCVMFRKRNSLLRFRPEDGMQVLANGYVSLYSQGGMYQFYVQDLEPHGAGSLHTAYEQLKTKLEEEGLFKQEYKQAIPVLPGKIGIVTSISGAALRDIIHVIRRRFPSMELVIAPAAVQGADAPAEIALAIKRLNEYTDAEVIIVGRGGGSLEELWAFNTESVARAIFQSRIPVISAVGHETDFTIADFVADVRAPTPSAAAELAVPEWKQLTAALEQLSGRLKHALSRKVQNERQRVAYLAGSRMFSSPEALLKERQQQLDRLARSLSTVFRDHRRSERSRLDQTAARLDAYSPLKIMGRGYSICRTEAGLVVRNSREVKPDQALEVVLAEGAVRCKVVEVKEVMPWQRKK